MMGISEIADKAGISKTKLIHIIDRGLFDIPKHVMTLICSNGMGRKVWDDDTILTWIAKTDLEERVDWSIKARDNKAKRRKMVYFHWLSTLVDRTRPKIDADAIYWKLEQYSGYESLLERDCDYKPLFDQAYGKTM